MLPTLNFYKDFSVARTKSSASGKNSSLLTEFDTHLVLRFYQLSRFDQIKLYYLYTATEFFVQSDRIILEGVGKTVSHPMRLKARGLWSNTVALLAGWRRVTEQGVNLNVMDGPCHLP